MGEREDVVGRVLDWYGTSARDLPWRRPDATPWGILVSEVMLQQTPVSRVLGPWHEWLERWPTPSALAAEPAGAAVAAWGRLGYPRRALRIHQAAVAIIERHGGEVPSDHDELRALPGVGEYTAAAVASFAFGARHVVIDTNVRRVLARVGAGVADQLPSAAARRLVESYLPEEPAVAARWGVASMELGALVCAARSPRCEACPLADVCVWRAEGSPALAVPVRRPQTWQGTDRQCRGALLRVVREAGSPIERRALLAIWPDQDQGLRCLDSLLADGLVQGPDPLSLFP